MSDQNTNNSSSAIKQSLLDMSIGINYQRVQRQTENEYLKPEEQRKPVDAYTVDEVLSTAEKLYQFVTKK